MPDRELERELRELGSHIEYPPTPDLARAVHRSLDREVTARQARSRRFWSSLPSPRWAAAATAFLLIVAVPALSPAMRATVVGWFEAGPTASSEQAAGEAAREVPADESAGLAPSTGRPRPSGGELGFGSRISLREARAGAVAGELLLPETLGEPDEVYAGEPPDEESITLVYGARSGLPPLGGTGIGLVLTESPGDVGSAYFREGERPEAGLQRARVGGKPGYWVPAGRGVSSLAGRAEARLHGSVLLWEQEGVALRLEADIPKQEAIRIAGSVR